MKLADGHRDLGLRERCEWHERGRCEQSGEGIRCVVVGGAFGADLGKQGILEDEPPARLAIEAQVGAVDH